VARGKPKQKCAMSKPGDFHTCDYATRAFPASRYIRVST
jgi:hypothetical protein